MYSSLPVATCTVPVLYLYYSKVVVYRSSAMPHWGIGMVRATFSVLPLGFCPIPTFPALRSTLPADPCLRSHAALAWDGTPTRHRATIRSIPWRHEAGHDPRVCVHPTVLPPKKISCHLIWLSSTSSVVNLK
jgi:hypothetical protein